MSEITQVPQTIHKTQILFDHPTFGARQRTEYHGIEELADSIAEVGLQVPVILSPFDKSIYVDQLTGEWREPQTVNFLLEAGGRRTRALETLFLDGRWDGQLWHGATSIPGRPGFLLKGEPATASSLWITELTENLFRDNLPWQDEMKLIVKAWREYKRNADAKGEKFYYQTLGRLLGGYGYSDIQAAVVVHDDVVASPDTFAKCENILQAYKLSLDLSKKRLTEELASRLRNEKPKVSVVAELEPGREEQDLPVEPDFIVIPFKRHFTCADSLDLMEKWSATPCFDHIICDPDFAISEERLSANFQSAGDGIAQESVEESLSVLARLFPLAFACMKDRGFFVMWYDLDHHNWLQSCARSAGFLVQRWPLIWTKPDFRSNAAPEHNFTKNVEYAMVCRKPGTTLATSAPLTSFTLPNGSVARDFSHPFAKPPEVWQKIYYAVASPGQTVYDPFLGSGSSVVAALRNGLIPYGSELNPSHFNNATVNIHKEYEKQLGKKVRFE